MSFSLKPLKIKNFRYKDSVLNIEKLTVFNQQQQKKKKKNSIWLAHKHTPDKNEIKT